MRLGALCLILALILIGCATKEIIPIENNANIIVVADAYPEWMTYIAETPELLYTIGEGNSEEEAILKAKSNFSSRIYKAFESIDLAGSDAFTEVMNGLYAIVPETVEMINDSLEVKDSYTNSLKQTWTILQIDRDKVRNILFDAWEKASSNVALFSNSLVKALADMGAKSSIKEFF